ncbi:unnamed protein product, partial [Candidula unifasciata]
MINLVVFCRQGLMSTINLSLFALSLADFSSLLLQLWMVLTSLIPYVNIPVVYQDLLHLTGGIPHGTFCRLSCSITVYITAERCLCVVFPMKITQLITLKRAATIIVCISMTTLLASVPIYFSHYLEWNFYPNFNRTLLGSVITSLNRAIVKVLYFANAISGVIAIAAVAIFTSILIWTLKEKSAWRRSANIQQQKSEALSNRDRSTLNMVVFIAVVLLICYTPSVILSVVTFFEPEFNSGRRYVLIYELC